MNYLKENALSIIVNTVVYICLIGAASLMIKHTAAATRLEVAQVIKASGYGVRNIKSGDIYHYAWTFSKSDAEEKRRDLDKNSFVKGTNPEYEIVEIYYRRVN